VTGTFHNGLGLRAVGTFRDRGRSGDAFRIANPRSSVLSQVVPPFIRPTWFYRLFAELNEPDDMHDVDALDLRRAAVALNPQRPQQTIVSIANWNRAPS